MKVRFFLNTKAFSLIELIVVMLISMFVLMVSTSAFENVIKISTATTKSAQSQIEGVVGLEILRKDLNAAGYALPWSFQTTPGTTVTPDSTKYLESDMGSDNPVLGLSSDDFNDAPPNDTTATPAPVAPRAVVLGTVPATAAKIISGGTMKSNPGTDYLVIKSAVVAFNNSVGKWGYVNYSGNQASNKSYIAKWNSTEDFVDDDVVITLRNTFSGAGSAQHVLAMENSSKFSYRLSAKNAAGNYTPPTTAPDDTIYKPTGNIIDPFGAKINNEKLLTYAIKSFSTNTTVDDPNHILRMPFNRADYFIRRPTDIPARCNPGTGVLYKAVIINAMGTSNSGGGQTLYPLIDCVGDMQVVFDMQDPIDANKTITQDNLTGLNAEAIRTRLKSIRVYLLVQEGVKDTKYKYPVTDINNVISVSDDRNSSLGRIYSQSDMVSYFGADWNNYRWKVYSVVGQPYNLMY